MGLKNIFEHGKRKYLDNVRNTRKKQKQDWTTGCLTRKDVPAVEEKKSNNTQDLNGEQADSELEAGIVFIP